MPERRRKFAGKVVVAVGVLLILFGIWKGEPDTVWNKAANICMECIGIG
ncbi:CD1871A family CXXC motif-containing protein [Coprococcus sp. AF21-14LB]|nr:CD1871A family CXXC motif-containing protein [Coprococcus sp. AF21-14LB]QUO32235.1 thioredoxin [Faecalicatena sp. Marseille-Q4148]RGS76942.1 thioredoxin [Coprococcus sp. AF21-14LB]